MKRIVLLLLLWATWGFSLGTLLLLGPLRWTINWSRSQHWTEGQEKARVYVLILLLAVVSFLIAKASAAYMTNQQKPKWRHLLFLVPLLGTFFSIYVFMTPKWMNNGSEESVGKQFVIGPYPDAEKLAALKNENYATIISLLHPAVIPFEPKLMNDEKLAAGRLGLDVIFISLLPWVSDNEKALDSLRKVIRQTTGKVYIHCYLGKDRVNIARRIVEQEFSTASMEGQAIRFRSLDSVKRLERGPVFQLEKGVFFTPFPTNEEYTGYVLSANFNQVISLADLSDPGAADLLANEKKVLAQMKIPFVVYDVSASTPPGEMQKMVAEIKKLPNPKLIHPFFTDSKEATLFRQLYDTSCSNGRQ